MTRKGSVVITNHHASLSCPSPQLEVTDACTQYRTNYDDQPSSPVLSMPTEPTHLEESKYSVLYKH